MPLDCDNAYQQLEPNGHLLAVQCASLFMRICCRQPRALQICHSMLQRAVRIASNNKVNTAEYLVELGYLHSLQGI